jgi:predicted house-cleaning noncanonical NTP pyrophosphatase (MazG superfamily)
MKKYDKLVRDRIPEIIEATGQRCTIDVLHGPAYLQALLSKLIEEAQEAAAASRQERAAELADVLEVVEAIMRAEDLDPVDVRQLQAEKREQRGGFQKGLWLKEVLGD